LKKDSKQVESLDIYGDKCMRWRPTRWMICTNPECKDEPVIVQSSEVIDLEVHDIDSSVEMPIGAKIRHLVNRALNASINIVSNLVFFAWSIGENYLGDWKGRIIIWGAILVTRKGINCKNN
jgi:hypothetical protein